MTPIFRPVAERAVLVEFADVASDATEARVRALDRALAEYPCPGQIDVVPAIVNLAIVFDPLTTDHRAVARHVRGLLGAPAAPQAPPRRHGVAMRYDGPDLTAVAAQTGLTPRAVIEMHQGADFHVVMYGFAPGYAYLGGLPAALRLDRKPTPLRDVPAGSVIIAGQQCLITTLKMPTGWWIIGHTDLRVLTGDADRPFLFDPGDHVKFRATHG